MYREVKTEVRGGGRKGGRGGRGGGERRGKRRGLTFVTFEYILRAVDPCEPWPASTLKPSENILVEGALPSVPAGGGATCRLLTQLLISSLDASNDGCLPGDVSQCRFQHLTVEVLAGPVHAGGGDASKI